MYLVGINQCNGLYSRSWNYIEQINLNNKHLKKLLAVKLENLNIVVECVFYLKLAI